MPTNKGTTPSTPHQPGVARAAPHKPNHSSAPKPTKLTTPLSRKVAHFMDDASNKPNKAVALPITPNQASSIPIKR